MLMNSSSSDGVCFYVVLLEEFCGARAHIPHILQYSDIIRATVDALFTVPVCILLLCRVIPANALTHACNACPGNTHQHAFNLHYSIRFIRQIIHSNTSINKSNEIIINYAEH